MVTVSSVLYPGIRLVSLDRMSPAHRGREVSNSDKEEQSNGATEREEA